MSYIIINLNQGDREWLEWRNQGIGASDAPTIMGENPWKTPAELLEEKFLGTTFVPNAAMMKGTLFEPEARRRYQKKVGIHVAPACVQSLKDEWLRASLDGLSADGGLVVEIKCGESVYRKASVSKTVPGYYYGQLQHILAVTRLRKMDFYCYLPQRPEIHLQIARNDRYITKLMKTESLFWAEIQKKRDQLREVEISYGQKNDP